MSTLQLKNINKIYSNNVQAVFDFNLDIKDKEFIVFVGPSGCGKSTTLRMVAGLEEITSGELYIDGKLVNNVAPKDRDIAMVFQSYALYPHMTVYENMAFALKLRKLPMPLYKEENPEIAQLNAELAVLWKKADTLNRRYKKKQDDLSILPERAELYAQIYALLDKIASLREPVMGKNEYRMAIIRKSIASLNKEIASLEAEAAKLQPKEDVAEEEAQKMNEQANVLTEGAAQRKDQVAKLEEELQYLQENDVELVKLRHLTKREIEVEINKVAASIDLIRYLYRKPSALSGGQRQRVALGRAIVRKPKVFLMDEPLSNLDAKLRVQTRSEIIKIHERVGATTIYVTHDQTEAMTMADRIVIMKDGYVQQIGSPEEVYNDPANLFVGSFIGSPSMNLININYSNGVGKVLYKAKEDSIEEENGEELAEIKLPKEAVELLKDYEGKDIVLGVRPENTLIEGNITNENPSQPIKAKCDFVELLGSELIIYFYLNGQRIIAKAGAKEKIKSRDDISICFDNSKLYFFDKETGNRIK